MRQLITVLNEVSEYPLHRRIAAKLFMEGITTEVQFQTLIKSDRGFYLVSPPVLINVQNCIRDLERGQAEISPALRMLANQLGDLLD